MNNTGKYIGLNQRIPFKVLDAAISFHLAHGVADREYILQLMQEFTSGMNRATKAMGYVVQILNRQVNLLDKLKQDIGAAGYSSLSTDD